MDGLTSSRGWEESSSPVYRSPQLLWHKRIKTPMAALDLVADDSALLFAQWERNTWDFIEGLAIKESEESEILKTTEAQLNEYFNGHRKTFEIPLRLEGTEFQKLVWHELLKIPHGSYISYGEQARRIGNPKAMRAVGAANGKNPIAIIVPCHRVFGASGSLTGYAGGIGIKQQLLTLEGIHLHR